MTIKFERSVSADRLTKQILDAREKEFVAACQSELAKIKERTLAGKDYAGKTFEKYSEAYAQKRREEGRRVYPPDLTITGQMLDALKVNFVKLGAASLLAEFYFEGAFNANKAFWNNARREFFRLAKEQIARIDNRLRRVTR